MASILEDWNGVSSGGISSGAYGNGNDMNISGGEGMDANVFSMSQVLLVMEMIRNSYPLTIHKMIQMRCFLFSEFLFLLRD